MCESIKALKKKDTSSFTSYTLLIRFPKMFSVYIVYRMYKVERRMVKTNTNYVKNNSFFRKGIFYVFTPCCSELVPFGCTWFYLLYLDMAVLLD